MQCELRSPKSAGTGSGGAERVRGERGNTEPVYSENINGLPWDREPCQLFLRKIEKRGEWGKKKSPEPTVLSFSLSLFPSNSAIKKK